MKIVAITITGGRFHNNQTLIHQKLDEIVNILKVTLGEIFIIFTHGDCSGTDHHGRDWARSRSYFCQSLAAPWNDVKKIAGPLRNKMMMRMLAECSADVKILVAFNGNTGTANCVKEARKFDCIKILFPEEENK